MVATARIRMLGRFDARLGDVDVAALGSERVQALLAFLVLHRDTALPRATVAFALWPDSDEAQARTNLRHVLHVLRRGVPGVQRYVEITPRTVRWRPDAPLRLDVADVDERLSVRAGDPARRVALREATELYRGDLLEGWTAQWLQEERDRLFHGQVAALAELAALAEAGGDPAEALDAAERLLRVDPLREDGHRLLMRVHAATGDRAAAVRAYHRTATVLERELGVQPSEATRAAYAALLGEGARAGSPRAARATGPPLVGRVPERARLTAAWRAATEGEARCVLVGGEAGIGKTRLVEEFRSWCGRRGAATAASRCYPAEGPLAYGPVVDWLRSDALRPRLARLTDARLTELARLLPELLAERPGLAAPQPLPVDEQRHRLFEALAAALHTVESLLLVVDDLPHADRETCQFLHYLLRSAPRARLLLVGTARTEDVAGGPVGELLDALRERERVDTVELGRFAPGETARLAELVTGAPLAGAELRVLQRETEGNPLFVVESLRAGRRSGSPPSPRVQAVIGTRLAQLGEPARRVLQVAAAIGRGFDTGLLAEVAGGSDEDVDDLVTGLDELWRRRIVRESAPGLPGPGYDFAHDKIRQVAYDALSPPLRRTLHARIAAAMPRLHRLDPGPVSAQIAAHHERSGAVEPAIDWYRRAAGYARSLHADARAVRLFDRALHLLDTLPPSAARDRTELVLRTAMIAALVPVDGYASPTVAATLGRATELAAELDAAPSPPLLRALALDALTRSDFVAATGHGARLRAAGERDGDDVLLVEGDYVLGIAAFWQTELAAAREHFELAVARYPDTDRTAHLVHYGQDPKVVCLGRLALTLWFLGLPDDAGRAHAEALAWSQSIEHPFSRAVALTFGAVFAVERGDGDELRAIVAELTDLAYAGMHATITPAFAGYVRVLDGEADAGLAAIRATLRTVAVAPTAPGQHALTARLLLGAALAAGDRDAALEAATRLLEMGGPARLWEPLARRVRAGVGHGVLSDARGTHAERRVRDAARITRRPEGQR